MPCFFAIPSTDKKPSTDEKERQIAKAKKRRWSELESKQTGQIKQDMPTHFKCTFCPDQTHALFVM